MRYLVDSKEMKSYDENTTKYFKIPSLLLMERAAVATVEILCSEVFQEFEQKVLVVCGTGNNGGDGLAVARMLLLKGVDTDIVLVGDKKKATEQNQTQQDILEAYGFTVLDEIPENTKYTVLIDAIFGVGLSRNIEGNIKNMISKMNEMVAYKVAIDVPSGISCDNGAILGISFEADLTVTFAFSKIGMHLWPANEKVGKVVVAEIGIDERSFLQRKPCVATFEKTDLKLLPKRPSHSNKGTFGKLLVIAGSENMSGAAYFSAKSAYASGCGLVRIFTSEENRSVLQTSLPEAILSTYSSKKFDVTVLNEAMKWADVIVCGPGIGTSAIAHQIVKNVIKNASVPVVFDADALNIIAEDTTILLKPHTEMVLTPHLGEMSRLTGDAVSFLQMNLIAACQEFAREYNVISVLKDEHTVISIPYGQTYLNLSGNQGMATAGSGDVLAGIIGGLMAQKLSGEIAAPLGVYLHGLAGDAMVEALGYAGLMASDIIDGIRKVIK